MPAKLTGKYQSYDINTPYQFTPPMPQTRRNTNPSVSLPGSTENIHHEQLDSTDFKSKKLSGLKNASNSDSDITENCIRVDESPSQKNFKSMSEISSISQLKKEEDGKYIN